MEIVLYTYPPKTKCINQRTEGQRPQPSV